MLLEISLVLLFLLFLLTILFLFAYCGLFHEIDVKVCIHSSCVSFPDSEPLPPYTRSVRRRCR